MALRHCSTAVNYAKITIKSVHVFFACFFGGGGCQSEKFSWWDLILQIEKKPLPSLPYINGTIVYHCAIEMYKAVTLVKSER